MSRVEVLALSHGHSDHTGGFEKLAQMVGREGIELFLHPAAYKAPRYLKLGGERRISFPRIHPSDGGKSGREGRGGRDSQFPSGRRRLVPGRDPPPDGI